MPLTTHSRSALGLWAALIAYGVVLAALIGAAPGGSDGSGYFNEARLFSHFRIHEPLRVLPGIPYNVARPFLYNPLGYRPAVDGSAQLVPTYSPGLPLMLVVAARVIGWRHAGDAVLLLHSLAGLVLTYFLGRRLGLGRGWSFAAAALLAISPLYLFMSLWAMSDVPSMVWATAAVVAAWKCRERPFWALASGLCAAVAFLVRPTNFLIAVPMLIVIGPSPRRLLLALLGGLPGVAAWMAINHAAYGAYLQSGYGAIGSEFHESLVPGTLSFCLKWLPVILSPLVIASPAIVGFLGSRTRIAAALASWAALYVAFYSPYRWTHEDWWFLRFLLPAAPALMVAGMIVLQWVFGALRAHIAGPVRVVLLSGMFATCAWAEARQIKPLHAWSIGHGEEKYGRVAAWLRANVPSNSAIIAEQFSGATYYFTNYVLIRSDELDHGTADKVRESVRSEGRPVYMVVFPAEKHFIAEMPGKWIQVSAVEDVSIWRGDWGDPAK
jgi:4-amino-4-deoxy-L-arabinose transferase-like glycosyltransferase